VSTFQSNADASSAAGGAGWVSIFNDYRELATQDLSGLADGAHDVGATEDWELTAMADPTSIDIVNGTGLDVVIAAAADPSLLVGAIVRPHTSIGETGGIFEDVAEEDVISIIFAFTFVSGMATTGNGEVFRMMQLNAEDGVGQAITDSLGRQTTTNGFSQDLNDGTGTIRTTRSVNPVTENVAYEMEWLIQGHSITKGFKAFSGTFSEPGTIAVSGASFFDRYGTSTEGPNVGTSVSPWVLDGNDFDLLHVWLDGYGGTAAGFRAQVHGMKASYLKLVTP
jgi:hypothetical protein